MIIDYSTYLKNQSNTQVYTVDFKSENFSS